MVFYMPGQVTEAPLIQTEDELTPRQTVKELDKYVVGQKAAKRAVALADKEPSIRAVAALNLGKIRATGAAGFLQERLEKDKSEMVREGALLGLLLLQE